MNFAVGAMARLSMECAGKTLKRVGLSISVMNGTVSMIKTSKSLLRRAILLGTAAAMPLAFAQTASAQNFTVTNVNETIGQATGNVDFDENGTIDGTFSLDIPFNWSINNRTFLPIVSDGFVGIRLDAQLINWTLDADFEIDIPIPGLTFQPTFHGSESYPNPIGAGYQNNITDYTLTWTGASPTTTAPANLIDPLGQANILSSTSNSLIFEQIPGTSTDTFVNVGNGNTQNCANNAGIFSNACVAWVAAVPEGNTSLSVTGDNANRFEGFGFGIMSFGDVAVDKVGPTELFSGETGSYTITLTNAGTFPASSLTNLAMTDQIPAGLTVTGVSSSYNLVQTNFTNPTTDYSAGTASFDNSGANATVSLVDGFVQLGDSIEITVDFTVDASVAVGTDLTNILANGTNSAVTMAQIDTNLANNDAVAVTTITFADADLSITKTNTPGVNNEIDQAADTLTTGDMTTYTITVVNNGPDSVTGAVVTDTVVEGLTCTGTDVVTLSGDGVPTGSFTIADLTGAGITLETLADGQSVTITYTCEVN